MTETDLLKLARGQHGVFSIDQALNAGLTRATVLRRRHTRRWDTLAMGIYGVAGSPPTWEQSAVVASIGIDGFISHDSAARLHRLALPETAPIHVTTVAQRSRPMPGVILHKVAWVNAHDVRTVDGILTATVCRTIVDLAETLGPSQLGAVMDDAIRRSLTTLDAIVAAYVDLGPRRGQRRFWPLKQALEDRRGILGKAESALERKALRILRSAGLPSPRAQHWVNGEGRQFRLDLAYVQERVAIELDGFSIHGDRTHFDNDRERRTLLELAGWQVLQFTAKTPPDLLVRAVRHKLR